MIVQLLAVRLVIAAPQHDTHQISKGIPDDFPIPRGRLRIPRHYICGETHLLGTRVSCKKLHRHLLLIQKNVKSRCSAYTRTLEQTFRVHERPMDTVRVLESLHSAL